MAAAEVQTEWNPMDLMNQDREQSHGVGSKSSSLLPALPVDGKNAASENESDLSDSRSSIEAKVESLGIHSSPEICNTDYPSPPSAQPVITDNNKDRLTSADPRHALTPFQEQLQQAPTASSKMRGANLPTPLQTHSLGPKNGQHGTKTPSTETFAHSPSGTSDSSSSSTHSQHPHSNVPHPWMANNSNGLSPRHGPLLTPGMPSPALSPHPTLGGSSSGSLPFPGTLTPAAGSRKNSVVSLGGPARASPGFRGAPLGQTSDTESVLKQFDVYFGKVYLRGQLQKKNELGVEGFKLPGQQWAAYTAELIGPKLRLKPMNEAHTHIPVEEMNLEEATVEMQDGPNGGTFTVNWKGANKAIFQPVQQLSLGSPEVGSTCQDWVCAIRLSCYECSRLQEIYTSTLLRRPKFRDQVAASIGGRVKFEGMLRVKFWAGEEWQRLYVVISDQRGEEIKKKKQGKILQAAPIRGQIHFYESSKSKKPFVSLYNVSQAYAVCPSRSSLNASKDNKVDEEGSLTIKLEGDVVMQRDNLTPQRKGFFSSPQPPSACARDLQALLPTGRAMFAMIQVTNAVERTKFLLGTSEAFRIYGKPGPLLFDSPMDPNAMNFGCMASSLLQQELLIGLDAVLHLPQKGESLADVKFSFGEVLRKRLIAENPSTQPHPYSAHFARRRSSIPYGVNSIPENMTSPTPMMMMAMRSRAYSGSGYLVPQPSPGIHPTHISPWTASPHSPQLGPYGPHAGSPRQGPLHASPYNQHLYKNNYAASNTSTDENDAYLATDDEGEDDEYPDTPEEEDDGLTTPAFRSRSGSLMVAPAAPGYAQVRKGSVGALSVQGGRAGRSASFTSAYGVQVVTPEKKAVLELPSLHSFSDDFKIQEKAQNQQQKKLTAVVYPTQIVIPKNKLRRDSSAGGPKSAASISSPSTTTAAAAVAAAACPPIAAEAQQQQQKEEQVATA
ncbi:hypothetical protein EDD11_010604 [Mortierella claussenii]|nr:hypothetical protein EDD11_010604 [Mortierella claussenii]